MQWLFDILSRRVNLTRWLMALCGLLLTSACTAPINASDPCALPTKSPWLALAPGVWVWSAEPGEVSASNRGHVSTQILLVGLSDHGNQALLIDPGPSLSHGQTVGQSARCQLGVSISTVINSHAHAENALGNAAYRTGPGASTQILATAPTRAAMAERCPTCLEAMREHAGQAALAGTTIELPEGSLKPGYTLPPPWADWELLVFDDAHTISDLALWHSDSRLLLAPGLIYVDRLPELAQGSLMGWLAALDALIERKPLQWVGNKPGTTQDNSLALTRQYLCDLSNLVWQAMDRGASPGDPRGLQLPHYQAWTGYTERHLFNVQRAWRELEPRWIANEPAPCP